MRWFILCDFKHKSPKKKKTWFLNKSCQCLQIPLWKQSAHFVDDENSGGSISHLTNRAEWQLRVKLQLSKLGAGAGFSHSSGKLVTSEEAFWVPTSGGQEDIWDSWRAPMAASPTTTPTLLSLPTPAPQPPPQKNTRESPSRRQRLASTGEQQSPELNISRKRLLTGRICRRVWTEHLLTEVCMSASTRGQPSPPVPPF